MHPDFSITPSQLMDESSAARSDVPAGSAFDSWRLRVLTPAEFSALGKNRSELTAAQLRYLARFGVLAPTTHNTVPQRFLVGAGSLEVWLDRTCVLPQSDVVGRQATVSCGCVIAHLCLAAAAYGWSARVDDPQAEQPSVLPLGAGGPRYARLARLTFLPSEDLAFDGRWLAAMLARKTVRAEFAAEVTLDETLERQMYALAARHPGTNLHVIRDAASLTILGKFQELADTTVYNREPFARELGQWLLPNDATETRGMRGREFGLGDAAAARLHRGLSGVERLLPDEVSNLAKSANKAMRSASAVAVITTENDSLAARLAAGRLFTELALLLRTRDYVTAMHAAITEVEGPNMALRGRLRTTWRPTVLFRIGRPARVQDGLRPHAARPPLEDLILAEAQVLEH